MRVRYRELREIEIDDGPRLPIDTPWPQPGEQYCPRPSATDRRVHRAWEALCAVASGVLELLLVLVAASCCSAGLLGRGLDHAGRAAARRSKLLTAGAEALAQLPPPRSSVELRHSTTAPIAARDR